MSDKNTTRYEIFGLHDDQVKSLSERFGDRVHSATEDTIVVDLHDYESGPMTGDGYFMKPAPKLK